MDPSPGIVTFSDFTTTAGQLVAAGAITTVVGLIKYAFPVIDSRISGATLSFLLSLALYVVVALSIAPSTIDGYLPIVIAWLGAAVGAMGIKAGVSHVQAVNGGYAGVEAPVVRDHSDDDESHLIPLEEDEPTEDQFLGHGTPTEPFRGPGTPPEPTA